MGESRKEMGRKGGEQRKIYSSIKTIKISTPKKVAGILLVIPLGVFYTVIFIQVDHVI